MTITEAEMMTRTFGCELEYEGISQAKAAAVVAEVVGGTPAYRGTHLSNWEVTQPDGRVWQVVSDGSLCGTSAEVVTPVMRYTDMATLQAVVRGLRKARAKVSERCGLHVHVGIADFTPVNIKNLVKTFYKNEKLILKAAGTLPRRIARYTRETDRAFIERICNLRKPSLTDINTAWFGRYNPSPYHYDEHRYRALYEESVVMSSLSCLRLFSRQTLSSANGELCITSLRTLSEFRSSSALPVRRRMIWMKTDLR